MEYKIDETFYLGRKKFQVVECSGWCNGCYFENDLSDFCYSLQDDYVGNCNHMHRKDKKDVCFKLVEE